MHAFPELLRERLGSLVTLSGAQVETLQHHCELMLRWNSKLNLTTVTKLDEVIERHYCESLFLGAHLPPGDWSIADVGSGAGFPGFPVAVHRPECRVTLFESHQRKSVFLRESSRELRNIRVRAERAERAGERFDWIVSRAVSYEDLWPALRELAERAALLTGNVTAAEMRGFEWEEPIPLPWGKHRLLWLGRKRPA